MRDDMFWGVVLYGVFLGIVGTLVIPLVIQYLAHHVVWVW